MQRLIWLFTFLLSATLLSAQNSCPVPVDLQEICVDAPADSMCSPDGTVTTLPALPADQSGTQLLKLSGSDDSEITLYMLDVTITGYERSASSGGLIEIRNRAGFNVNLRGGPGVDFDVVGVFRYDETLMADGRSGDGQWFRVQLDSGPAWVGVNQVAVDPALDDLPVVDQSASSLSGHSLHIRTVESDCSTTQGVLINSKSETSQHLTLNGMPLSIEDGAVFVELADETLLIFALSGESRIGTDPVEVGTVVLWTPGGLDTPDPVPAFPPLAIFDQLVELDNLCLMTSNQSDAVLSTFENPDHEADPSITLDGSRSYPVAQNSADGMWLRTTEVYGAGWIPGESMLTWGVCDSLPEPEAVRVFGAGLLPDQVMMMYLNARVSGDRATMSNLACAAYQGQVAVQAQSFRAMRAELQGVACTTTQQNSSSAIVSCSGSIQTEYNGAFRQWPPGSYQMSIEDDAWRVCGEAN